MPQIRLVLEDDQGNPLPNTEQVYPLEGECNTLNQIEASIETFRKKALPPLEKELLAQAQQRYLTEAKKNRP